MDFTVSTTLGGKIIFVDEQLSPITVVYGDVPGIGDEVQWGQEVYVAQAVRRYYDTDNQEHEFAARVVVRPLEQE